MKIEEQVLSREQMAHLVELGVDTSDASMCWIKFANSEINEYHLDIYDGTSYKEMKTSGNIVRSVVPTYTTGDLIEKLCAPFDPVYGFLKDYTHNDSVHAVAVKSYKESLSEIEYSFSIHYENMTFIEALYHCLCDSVKNTK